MMLFFPLLLVKFPSRKMVAVLLLIAIGLIPLAWNRLWVFADPYRLWNEAALLLQNKNVSGSDRIYYNRGNAELSVKKWDEAVLDYQRVISHNPKIAEAYANLGVAYFGLKRYQDAIKEFNNAIKLNPNYAQAYFNKGLAYKRLHNEVAALEQINKSCELGNQMGCVIVAYDQAQKK